MRRIGALLVLSFAVFANSEKKQYVSFVEVSPSKLSRSESNVAFKFKVAEGFHIQSNPPSKRKIATALTLVESDGLKFGMPKYPEGKPFKLKSGEPISVYENEFVVEVPVTAAKEVSQLEGKLRYQACDDTNCFFPQNLDLKIALK